MPRPPPRPAVVGRSPDGRRRGVSARGAVRRHRVFLFRGTAARAIRASSLTSQGELRAHSRRPPPLSRTAGTVHTHTHTLHTLGGQTTMTRVCMHRFLYPLLLYIIIIIVTFPLFFSFYLHTSLVSVFAS